MGYWSGFCLKLFLSVKIIIKGMENIIKITNFLSHHLISRCSKLFLQTILTHQFYFEKRINVNSNIWMVLKKIGSLSIKRNKITKENLNFIDDILEFVRKSNRPLIIFPQATRVLPNDRPAFKKGV